MRSNRPFKDICVSFIDDLERKLSSTSSLQFNYALSTWIASYLWANTLAIYRNDLLEEHVLRCIDSNIPNSSHRCAEYRLHVISEAYSSGGHTRLLSLLLQNSATLDQVLLTRSNAVDETAFFLGIDKSRIMKVFEDDLASEIIEIARTIARFNEVILYIHPNDVKCATAVRLAKAMHPQLKVGLLNYADHSFSVGIGACDFIFEISTYGWRLREARKISDKASFVGIPIRSIELTPTSGPECYALTAGPDGKYKPSSGFSFADMVEALLTRMPDLRFRFIGSGEAPFWRDLKTNFGSGFGSSSRCRGLSI